jgi:hypothetical protein
LRERSRIEQVFGSVKSAYGSYLECRREASVMVRVWVQLVLWNKVQSLRVKAGGGGFFCCGVLGMVVCWWFGGWERNFRTPSSPLDKTVIDGV